MHYNRKAAAVFILILTLILPLFLEKEEATAVVNLERVISASAYLTQIEARSIADSAGNEITLAEAENEIMEILKKESAELAARNNYSSILIDHSIYQGGKDITQELASKIDKNYK